MQLITFLSRLIIKLIQNYEYWNTFADKRKCRKSPWRAKTFLISDGGNVEIAEIDGPIVKVRLQGACGSCPSSTMTLKMGIERKLKEMIPEISEVVQVLWKF